MSAGAGVATIRGRRVPEVRLADLLGLPSELRGAGSHVGRPSARGRRPVCARGRSTSTTMRNWWSSLPRPRSWRPGCMPARPLPTTAARSCCSTRRASRRWVASGSKRRIGPRALSNGRRRCRPGNHRSSCSAALDGGRRALRLAVVDRIEEVPLRAFTPFGGTAAGPAWRGDPAVAGAPERT